MRIHRIRLQDFRGVIDREITFAVDGVTIVEGPNEAGKTSVAEAIDLLFGFPDSSSARQVRDVAPVHRDVGPRVDAEVSTGGYRFRYAKQWLKQKGTTLDILEPRREQLTGRQAHERVERILAETMDRDLWTALRVRQGAELAQAAVDTPSLARALDTAAGGASDDPDDEDLLARVTAERDRYWTAAGKPRSERRELSDAVAAATAEVDELTRSLGQLDAHAERVEALTRRLDDLAAQRAVCVEERDAARDAVRAVDAAEHDLQRLSQHVATAESAAAAARSELARRDELVDDLTSAEADHAKLLAEQERCAPSLDEARRDADDAARRLADLEARLGDAHDRVGRRRAQLDHLRRRDDLAAWRGRLERVDAAEAARSAARAALDGLRVDHQAVDLIEQAHREVVEATARLEVAGARVTAQVHAPTRLGVGGFLDDVAAGERRVWIAGEPLIVEVDDLLTLTVEPGDGARDLGHQAEQARRALATVCDQAGVTSLEEAREALHARLRAERDESDARADLERDLDGLTPALLAETVEDLSARVVAEEAALAEDLPSSVLAAESVVHDAEQQARALESERRELAADHATHRSRLESARVEEQSLAARLAHVALDVERLASRLAEARAVTSDDDLREALEAADAELAAALGAVDTARADLAALDPETTRARLVNAEAAVDRLDAAVAETRDERQRLAVTLEVQGERGLAAELDSARTRLEHLQREHRRLEARAHAARLLHDTIEARRSEARQRYLAPFRAQIERLGKVVFGPGLEIELDDHLRIARRVLDGVALDFDQLSVGAREQLGILARLACASIVSADGGAPVIFDDVLGYTDPERLRTMGTAIAAASAGCQVIILTCTPGRYAQVGNATVVRLAADQPPTAA